MWQWEIANILVQSWEKFFLASKIQFRNQSLSLFFFIKETSVPHVVLMQISKITSSSSQAGYSPPSNSFDNLNFEYYLLQRNLIVIEGYCQLESNHLGIFDDVNFIQIQLQIIPSDKRLIMLDEMFQQITSKNLNSFLEYEKPFMSMYYLTYLVSLMWVFKITKIYGKFLKSAFLEHFIKHKPLIFLKSV